MKHLLALLCSCITIAAAAQKIKAKPQTKLGTKTTAKKSTPVAKTKFVITSKDSVMLQGIAEEYCNCLASYWSNMSPKAKEYFQKLGNAVNVEETAAALKEEVEKMDSTEKAALVNSLKFLNEEGDNSWSACMEKVEQKEKKYFGTRRSSKDKKLTSMYLANLFAIKKDCEFLAIIGKMTMSGK
jgi:hypothetical protein